MKTSHTHRASGEREHRESRRNNRAYTNRPCALTSNRSAIDFGSTHSAQSRPVMPISLLTLSSKRAMDTYTHLLSTIHDRKRRTLPFCLQKQERGHTTAIYHLAIFYLKSCEFPTRVCSEGATNARHAEGHARAHVDRARNFMIAGKNERKMKMQDEPQVRRV